MTEKDLWMISLGAFGTVLGCLNLFWQIYKHYQEKRDQKNQLNECATTMIFLKDSLFCVKVFNRGSVALSITEVAFWFNGRSFALQTVIVQHALPTAAEEFGNEIWQLTGRKSYPESLSPKHTDFFALATPPIKLLDMSFDPDQVRLTVSTDAGRLVTIPGPDFADTLDELRERMAKAELVRISPSAERLRELAASHPPPQSWYDEDTTGLF